MVFLKSQVVEKFDTKLTVFQDGTFKFRRFDKDILKVKDGFEPFEDTCVSSLDSSLDEKNESFKLKSVLDSDGRVRFDSVARSRRLLIDLAWNNRDIFKSFVTLTFKENIKDLKLANAKLNIYFSSIRRKFPEFSYLGTYEYQKRGSVHYHFLTNLDCGSFFIPARKIKKVKSEGKWKHLEFYDLKYWNYGFSSAFNLKLADDKFNISLYICKYLYKDLSERLFYSKKVLHSNNLIYPIKKDFDSSDDIIQTFFNHIIFKYGIDVFKFEPRNDFQIGFEEFSLVLDYYDLNLFNCLI